MASAEASQCLQQVIDEPDPAVESDSEDEEQKAKEKASEGGQSEEVLAVKMLEREAAILCDLEAEATEEKQAKASAAKGDSAGTITQVDPPQCCIPTLWEILAQGH